MISYYWLSVGLFRIAFPAVLAGCTIWRPAGLSLVYLALALVSPMLPVPTSTTMKGHTGRYLVASVGLTFLCLITQLIFHVVLLTLPPYAHFLGNCVFLEKLFRHIGLVRLDNPTPVTVFYWLVPDLVAFPSTVAIYIICRHLSKRPIPGDDADTAYHKLQEKRSKERSAKVINFLGSVGTYAVLAALCLAAALKPSVEGAVYFLVFIGSATWWAFHRELRRGFAFVCRALMLLVACHILALLSYQNQWPQEALPSNASYARYFALTVVYRTNCSHPRETEYVDDADGWIYAYALRLFILYFVLALQSQYLFQKPAKQRTRLSGKLDSLDTPLSRHVSVRKRTPSQRWQSARRKARVPSSRADAGQPNERTPLMRFGSGRTGLLQDSTGSVIVQDGQQDDSIQLQSLSEGVTEDKPGVVEHVIMAVYSIFQLIVNSSYLATNIIMMTWSIMYHSWTTFALLLWALILWMVPNQRAAMMKCSPFIVLYSTLLLLIQFVYSMDLTEQELPTVIHGIKMADIGFQKTSELSCWHLVVKCLFMTMFWITMRQYTAEKMRQRRSSTLRDMVAPLHVSVTTATTAMNSQDEPEIKSKFMQEVGLVIKKFLTKYWIAVVAVMLFTSGITGERMTVFRIIYMSLFLFFIVTFQISYVIWRKVMYGFWLTVIGYSIVMLILIYTYQFPDFPEYWQKYLYISDTLQKDIGLITYDTKDLFVRLLTPTFFVIITVIQIHYFHHDFLEVTNMKRVSVSVPKERPESPQSTLPIVSPNDIFADADGDRREFTIKELKHMSKLELIDLLKNISHSLYKLYSYLWLFLEIHMLKIIFISFILLCLEDVCAINFLFVLTVTIAINFNRTLQLLTVNIMAAAIASLMVIKMLYQIDYIKHENWNENCTEQIGNKTEIKTYNMAEWIGLKKTTNDRNLPKLLEGYIGILTITTFRAIITVRQWFYRLEMGQPLTTPSYVFPNVKRDDADKGILPCLKFLINYGFYKFGLEFCLMGIVTLIGTRLDFCSVLYSIWLLILFAMHRKTISRVWPVLKIFGLVMLPLQYALVVAPPTWLCIEYPWKQSEIMRGLQEWMYLPDPDSPPNSRKLICDFILLLMIVRQSAVFGIEQQHLSSGEEFVAGHNYSVADEIEKLNFVNPVKDYVSHIHNWLDVFKRGSMMSLMWITLSIMFLAGTKRTNLFSLGYLIGAFVFLWQGSDFYLRPPSTIMKWWNVLIGYNVFVIFCKTLFQGIGCVFINNLESYGCWCIQLLGIACLKKFEAQFKSSASCDVDREDIGMVWDGLCFGFLLIQKRLFRSYYFFHIVDETKAMSILASRGAELLEELHQKRIDEQENAEKAVLQKIKFKMDQIKANQRKIQGPNYREPPTHTVGEAPLARTSSMSSCISSSRTPPQGYQTPIDEDEGEEIGGPGPTSPRTASLLQPPSPNSAIMTVSLEGYLEPMRISFGSPPSSELNPRGPSPDETFPVFSPPPRSRRRRLADEEDEEARSSAFGEPRHSSYGSWTNPQQTPRRSIISTASRSPRSHHTYHLYKPIERPTHRHRTPKSHVEAVRSGDYYMFDDLDDDDLTDIFPDKDDKEAHRREPGRRMTVGELMDTLMKTDIEITTHVALYGGTTRDALQVRRRSEPLTRKKSSMSYLSARSDTDTAAVTDQPTTSTADEDATEREVDEFSVKDEGAGGEGSKMSFLIYLKFAWAFLNSAMVSMTRYLNRFSDDYRYVRKVLAKEKKLLKAKPDFRMGTRLGINKIWQPLPIVKQRSIYNGDGRDDNTDQAGPSRDDPWRKETTLSVPQIRILAPSMERGLDESSSSQIFTISGLGREDENGEALLSEVDQPPVIQLAASIWFGILAHSTFLCYFMVFLHQIKNASLLSTPLPLMVFLWGSLTIPRPSKSFWITMIAYIEVIVILKCICQPAFLEWNKKELSSSPFEVPRLVGVERQPNYALWDLLLLLVVFFHRFMLKSLGQWTTPVKQRTPVPVGYSIATMREPAPTSTNKPRESATSEAIEGLPPRVTDQPQTPIDTTDVTTPEGRTINVHITGDDEQPTDIPPTGDNERLVVIEATETDVVEEELQQAIRLTVTKHVEPLKLFFGNILDQSGKEKTNVYAYMFLCDFFNFLLLIFGFSAFGAQQGDGGVAAYFAENRVPMPFLLMLLLQFALIVIDRALFLKKSIAGKLIFQYCLVIGVHIWMFIILPSATERKFNTKVIPQVWYMVKCFYLLLAAYQLRLGYPTRILGNFLCKKSSIVNYTLFKGFMLVPFLFEMRAVMDWIWTDTSMTVMDWFKMEDIFANIYQIKCMRGLESDYPQPRGIKKKQFSKYMIGGGALFLMIGMIWFPLLLFALGGAVGISNLPFEVNLDMRIGSYEPIYSMSAQNHSIFQYSQSNYNDLRELYELTYRDRLAVSFLENYVNTDVAAVKFSFGSSKIWNISPPDKIRMIEELLSDNIVTVRVQWTVAKKPAFKDTSGVITSTREIEMEPYVNGTLSPVRRALAEAINGSAITNGTDIRIRYLLPMFLKVTGRTVTVAPQLMKPLIQPKSKPPSVDDDTSLIYKYRDVTIAVNNNSLGQQWFSVQEHCDDPAYNATLNQIPLNDCSSIVMFLFNDKVFPEGLSFISGLGIFGLYTTAVILVSSFIKRMVSDMAPKIMFEDLPYVDRILRLCLDIYLVRESGDLCLEEDLFAKLVFLYRSPETLIRWTRPPEPGEQTDGDEDENYNEIDDHYEGGEEDTVQLRRRARDGTPERTE